MPTDTEIRFISFTDEENGKNGSRYLHLEALRQQEAQTRMIGDIQLDMLGGLGSSRHARSVLMDGETNWLSDLIGQKNASWVMMGGVETASDHTSFPTGRRAELFW